MPHRAANDTTRCSRLLLLLQAVDTAVAAATEAAAAATAAALHAAEAAAALQELCADDDAASPPTEDGGWQVVVRKAAALAANARPFNPAEEEEAVVKAPGAEEEGVLLFETSSKTEALFLMGIGGRNVSLIRKHTKVAIYIRDGGAVWMQAKWPNSDTRRAWRMVLSACCGGILRWFATPAATQKWCTEQHAAGEVIAERYGCTLELLRSRVGHMCLMLVPSDEQLFGSGGAAAHDAPDDAAMAHVRAMLPLAREELLQLTRGE